MNARLLNVSVIEMSTDLSTRSSRESFLRRAVHERVHQKRGVELPEVLVHDLYRGLGEGAGLGNENEVICPTIIIGGG